MAKGREVPGAAQCNAKPTKPPHVTNDPKITLTDSELITVSHYKCLISCTQLDIPHIKDQCIAMNNDFPVGAGPFVVELCRFGNQLRCGNVHPERKVSASELF